MEGKFTEWFQKQFLDHNFVCLFIIIIIILFFIIIFFTFIII